MLGRGLARVALGPGPPHLVPAVALGAGDVFGEIEAFEARKAPRGGDQRLDVEIALGVMRERHVGGALLPDRPGQPPGVDPADADPAAPFEPAHERLGGAPVRRLGRVPLHDQPVGDRITRLVVLGIDADIPDMREGEGHDLARVGGVGHDLLVACHRRVEAKLGDRLAGRAKAMTVEDRPVRQNQTRGGSFGSGHGGFP